MAKETYQHIEDSYVQHIERHGQQVTELWSPEDDRPTWTFPADWTDDDVFAALAFANHTFDKGVVIGQDRKASEIKAVLGITSN